MNKLKKILLGVLIVMGFVATTNVNAAPATIVTSGSPTLLPGYINGTRFHIIPTSSGEITYCLNLHKTEPRSHTMYLSKEMDAGFAYILSNGYPRVKMTGDSYKDYYITQSALWWYMDDTQGTANLSSYFRNAADPYGLKGYINNLVAGAKQAKASGYKSGSVSFSSENNSLSLSADKKYYESKVITLNAYNATSIAVSMSKAPQGTFLANENNTQKTSFAAGDKFKILVPVKSMTDTNAVISLSVSGKSSSARAYEYLPSNDALQNLAVLYTTATNVSAKADYKLSTSFVKIVKIDEKTKKALAGAEFVLKNSKGETITSWTSTNNYHQITNLPNGTYILKETKAPKGYKMLKDSITFTITDTNREVTIKVENTPKTNVVSILKIDKATSKPLAGAVLEVRNSKGEVVAKFTTTEKAYILQNLDEGEYTVVELSAPEGYIKSDEVKRFVIDEDHISHEIIFDNHPTVDVPKTSATTIMYILGSLIILSGIGYIYYYERNKKQTIN